jgi:Zn-finger nucleic acid-binding protein
MNCPNCSTEMDSQALEGKLHAEIEVDVCFGCHVLWLDRRESIQLSAGGTLDLFRALNEHTDDPRHSLREAIDCPRCDTRLEIMRDIGKAGRFSYYRCPIQHGRLTPFSEFLKEKQFVRTLNPLEQRRLSAEVKQVQCSSCGGPVVLSEGFACEHCGSALTVLDPEAVEKALAKLDEADAARKAVPPEVAEARARAKAAMETMRTDPTEPRHTPFILRRVDGRTHAGADLLSASINFLFKALG